MESYESKLLELSIPLTQRVAVSAAVDKPWFQADGAHLREIGLRQAGGFREIEREAGLGEAYFATFNCLESW